MLHWALNPPPTGGGGGGDNTPPAVAITVEQPEAPIPTLLVNHETLTVFAHVDGDNLRSFTIDWGDGEGAKFIPCVSGSIMCNTSTAGVTSPKYTVPGQVVIKLDAMTNHLENGGFQQAEQQTITVSVIAPPVVTATVSPVPVSPVNAILTTDVVTLTVTVSGVELVSYAIDWGAGTYGDAVLCGGELQPPCSFSNEEAKDNGATDGKYPAGTYAINVKVTYHGDHTVKLAQAIPVVVDTRPTLDVAGPESIIVLESPGAAGTAKLTPTSLDSDGDLTRLVINWGDGSAAVTIDCTADGNLCNAQHTHDYTVAGKYTVTANLFDKHNVQADPGFSKEVKVDNRPVVDSVAIANAQGAPPYVPKNNAVELSVAAHDLDDEAGGISDFGLAHVKVTWAAGVFDTYTMCEDGSALSKIPCVVGKHKYTNEVGDRVISVIAVDKLGVESAAAKTVTVHINAAPALTSVGCPLAVATNGQVTVPVVGATDEDGDLKYFIVTWESGSVKVVLDKATDGVTSFVMSTKFATAAVYKFTVTAYDQHGVPSGEPVEAECPITVVDPNFGFITGGGWINSAAVKNGKATFGECGRLCRFATSAARQLHVLGEAWLCSDAATAEPLTNTGCSLAMCCTCHPSPPPPHTHSVALITSSGFVAKYATDSLCTGTICSPATPPPTTNTGSHWDGVLHQLRRPAPGWWPDQDTGHQVVN